MLNNLSREHLNPDQQITNAREAALQLGNPKVYSPWMAEVRVYRKLLGDLLNVGSLHPWQKERLDEIDAAISDTFGWRSVEVLSRFNRATDPQSIEGRSRRLIFASPTILGIKR